MSDEMWRLYETTMAKLTQASAQRDALAQGLRELIFSIESTHHDDNAMAQPMDLAKACLRENAP